MIITAELLKKGLKNPDPRIKDARADHKELLMHVHGIGVTKYLTKVEGLESETKIKLRQDLARSNKSLFADVLRPTDKIFTAKGGSKIIGLPDSKQEELKKRLNSIRGDVSLSKWIENIWLDKYATDPNGVILIEHKDDVAWPTYKSINSIRDYKVVGQQIIYIIFEPETIKTPEGQVTKVRVYDKESDKTYLMRGDEAVLIKDESFDNPWGEVPGIVISDLVNPVTGFKKSSIDEQTEIASEYLREGSIKTLFKYHHGFPFFWQYLSFCAPCKGTKLIDGKKCPSCSGTGLAMKKDVSDVTYLKPPTDADQPALTELANYVVPPVESWRQMTEESELLRDMIVFSHWGTVLQKGEVERTATEVTINAQPIQDRLNKYTDSAEIIETALTDFLGKFYYGDAYKGAVINYGRNYIIKNDNQISKEYAELKKDNAGLNLLNAKLLELISAKYSNDPMSQVIHEKLMHVEPFVHNTIKEVKDLEVDAFTYATKVFYNDWLSQVKKDDAFKKAVGQLKKDLETFTEQKLNNLSTKNVNDGQEKES